MMTITPQKLRRVPPCRHVLLGLLASVLLFAGTSFRCSAAGESPRDLQIFLLMGQANMAGRSPIEAEDKQPHPRVWVLNEQGRWIPAVEPLHFDKPARVGVGPGLAFGKALAEANPGMQIGLVPCSVGGTPLSRWEKGGDLYSNAIARARQAMSAGRLRGAIWHQGENDSRAGDPAPTYEDRLTRMIGALRADLGAPQLPFVVGELGHFLKAGEFPQMPIVNGALKKVAAAVPMTGFASAEGLKDKGDASHFATASQREFGRRYAQEMQRLLAPGSGPQGGR